MSELPGDNRERAKLAHGYMIQLGHKAIEMSEIPRGVFYPNRAESDSDHSYHLSMTAVELAANFYPKLDVGLVAIFANVHDLVEVITGDVQSYNLTKQQRREKHEMEQAAIPELLAQLPPKHAEYVQRYEEQIEPEARFVRVVDKLLPAVIHTVATEANKEEFFRRYGIQSEEHLAQLSSSRSRQLREEYPEFEFLHLLRQLTSSVARKKLLEIGNGATSDHSRDE